jgi:alkylhydroperoxidase family enzyme
MTDPVPARPARVPRAAPPFDVGNQRNITMALANSTVAFTGFVRCIAHMNRHTELPADAREAAILRVGAVVGSEYEWGQHVPRARRAGLTDEQIRAVRAGDLATLPPVVAVAARYAEAVERRTVDDEVWVAVAEHFTSAQVVELTTLAGFYGLVSRLLLALDVPLDDDIAGFDTP